MMKFIAIGFGLITVLAAGVLIYGRYYGDKPNTSIKSEVQQVGNVLVDDKIDERKIDLESTLVKCKNGDKYTGKDLIEKGMNFQTSGRMITYKGEELQKLCDPTVKEYDYDMEPNYGIVPSYQN